MLAELPAISGGVQSSASWGSQLIIHLPEASHQSPSFHRANISSGPWEWFFKQKWLVLWIKTNLQVIPGLRWETWGLAGRYAGPGCHRGVLTPFHLCLANTSPLRLSPTASLSLRYLFPTPGSLPLLALFSVSSRSVAVFESGPTSGLGSRLSVPSYSIVQACSFPSGWQLREGSGWVSLPTDVAKVSSTVPDT